MTEKLQIKYRTAHKALPPQPIRLKVPGWAGAPEITMDNGSEPQPWHCPAQRALWCPQAPQT